MNSAYPYHGPFRSRPLMRLLTAVVLLCSLCAPQALASAEHPALWRVDHGDSTLYLFGTVHFMPQGYYPLHPVIEDALASSDTLVLEFDLSKIDERDVQQLTLQQGLARDGRRLSTILDRAQWAALKQVVESLGLQPALFDAMQPWLAALTLTAVSYGRAGLTPEQGVDTYLLERAGEDARVLGLEDLESQLRLFTDLSEDMQVELLMQTVEQLPETERLVMAALEAWEKGDVDTLGAFLVRMYKEEPDLYDALITRRHAVWLPQLRDLLDEPGTHFIAVGALHLTGDDSVIRGLEKEGYEVNRVD